MVVFAAIMPHPPESISGIGSTKNFRAIEKTLRAFEELRIGIEKAEPDAVIVISPHAYLEKYYFAVNCADELIGNFTDFGLDNTYEYPNDIAIVNKISNIAPMKDLPVHLRANFLDYGALIPLHHLLKNIRAKVVHLSFSMMSYDFHYRYGETIQKAIGSETPKRVAIIASADLSHRLTHNAPAGFSEIAKEFDQSVIHALEHNEISGIMNLDQKAALEAAECGIRSIIILLGVLHGMPYKFDLLSYESPFGIGYMTARLV